MFPPPTIQQAFQRYITEDNVPSFTFLVQSVSQNFRKVIHYVQWRLESTSWRHPCKGGSDGDYSRHLSRDPGAPRRAVYWVTKGKLPPAAVVLGLWGALNTSLEYCEALKTTACKTYLNPPVENNKRAPSPPYQSSAEGAGAGRVLPPVGTAATARPRGFFHQLIISHNPAGLRGIDLLLTLSNKYF